MLQNAADAAALAGGSVLIADNKNCLANLSPYTCSGKDSGTCKSDEINRDNVIATAQAVATQNRRPNGPVPIVEIVHYTFASTQSQPGTFEAKTNASQLDNWVTQFSLFCDLKIA